jgi:hypothetical protein
MGLQVPLLPVIAHERQTSVQAELQQNPSTQLLLLHSILSLQVAPSALRPHWPIWHSSGGMHWLLALHESKQAVPPVLQTKGAQSRDEPAPHLPWPSQVDSEVYFPAAHFAATHTVPGVYFRQPPVPLQVPSLPQVPFP